MNNGKLSTPIQYVKGVGPHLSDLLAKKDIRTIEDALYFLPRTYEDRRQFKSIRELKIGQRETGLGEIKKMNLIPYRKRKIFEMVIGDESGFIKAKWFHFNIRYIKSRYKLGQRIIFSGDIRHFNVQKEIHHPDIEILEEEKKKEFDSLHFGRIVPIYSETEGLFQKTIRRIMKNVVDHYSHYVVDPLPQEIKLKYSFPDLNQCLPAIHFPNEKANIENLLAENTIERKRLVFDDFFYLQLALALKKANITRKKGIQFTIKNKLPQALRARLPFTLTQAQERAIAEIYEDMQSPYPMNRLIQGDVGSGKTLVAILAALVAIENGYQAAIMVPTEILAEQHAATLREYFKELPLKTVLLKSDLKKSEKDEILTQLVSGQANFIIGTHALIQEGVNFHKLGLIVVDEQHRFGVRQRLELREKGENPDLIVMTATPIPRTLALTAYGDLDFSIIDEMPAGRQPVVTKLFYERQRGYVYNILKNQMKKGNQIFMIYPLVAESEKLDLKDATQMYEHLKKDIFPEFKLALLHGQMKAQEKDAIMLAFKEQKIQLLVSTTVVEVGIDIPQATVMVVEHAERFGLSQLHQLRGRVGRGTERSLCILMAQYRKTEEATRRLKVMEETTDGFKIAEEDLSIRGPGEFLGTRQSGLGGFRIANLVKDQKILQLARQEAFHLIQKDPQLILPEHQDLKTALKTRMGERLKLIQAG